MDQTKLAVSVGLLIVSVAVTRVATVRVDAIGSALPSGQLYDVFHAFLPDLRRYEHIIDAFPISAVAVAACVVPLREWSRVIFSLALVYVLRALCISLTVLPSPLCRKGKSSSQSIGGCHDCIFSGHTATVAIAWLFALDHAPWLLPIALAHGCATLVAILGTRSHWSIDVAVALIVAYMVHQLVQV